MKSAFTLFVLLLLALTLQAQTTDVIPQGFSGTAGGATFTGPFTSTARSYQLVVDSSQLTNLLGQQITGLTFRSSPSATTTWPASSFSYADYDIYMGPANPIASGGTTFTMNEAGPQTQVRSGSLSFNAGDFPTGGVNSWGPVIMLTSPYTYTGGHLAILIRHSTGGTNRAVDAVGTSNSGYGTLFRAAWGSGYTSTGGSQGNFGVTQLTFVTPLSITLLNLRVHRDGDAAILRWESDDASVSHFAVERSLNGRDFKDAGVVYPETVGQDGLYQFRDERAGGAGSAIYYRLRILDRSGEQRYSSMVQLKADVYPVMVLAPNPVTDLLQVRFDAGADGTMLYKITDISGRQVGGGAKAVSAGMQELQVEVSALPAGLYSFWLNTGKEQRSRQFLKR